MNGFQLGWRVEDFRIDTYDTASGEFGEVSLQGLREAGRWTILFFYPADFTFV